MAFLGSQSAFLGIDVGTSSIKIVELVRRRRRTEVATYAQADLVNPLISPDEKIADEGVQKVATIISQMMDQAGVSTDAVVVALPSSAVFSAVIDLPNIPAKEMPNAVKFAAQDIVPADLDEMVLGWSKVGGVAQKQVTQATEENKKAGPQLDVRGDTDTDEQDARSPIFITAAPKQIVERYTNMINSLKLNLIALELETFPLVRSLISNPKQATLIADLGDKATTFHIVDQGAPRVTHTIDEGGGDITDAIEKALSIDTQKAEAEKARFGVSAETPEAQLVASEEALGKQIKTANRIVELYEQRSGKKVTDAILIGGGAKLKGISQHWESKTSQRVSIGNPWKGLSYPDKLETRLQELGSTYGVAVGLALRGLTEQS